MKGRALPAFQQRTHHLEVSLALRSINSPRSDGSADGFILSAGHSLHCLRRNTLHLFDSILLPLPLTEPT